MTMQPTGDQPNTIAPPNNTEGRDGGGRFIRTIETVQQDALAADLRARGYTYRQIANHLGVDIATAHLAVQRAMREVVQEAAEDARRVEVARLDRMLCDLGDSAAKVHALLERKHFTVSSGKLIYLGDEPLEDDGFVLAAIDRLNAIEDRRLKVQERRARLLGLDIPVRQEIDVNGGVEYRIVGIALEEMQ